MTIDGKGKKWRIEVLLQLQKSNHEGSSLTWYDEMGEIRTLSI